MPRGSGRSRQLEEITWKVVDNLYDEPSLHADFADRYADVRERLRDRTYSSSAALSTVFG